jgi:hypothetical protein
VCTRSPKEGVQDINSLATAGALLKDNAKGTGAKGCILALVLALLERAEPVLLALDDESPMELVELASKEMSRLGQGGLEGRAKKWSRVGETNGDGGGDGNELAQLQAEREAEGMLVLEQMLSWEQKLQEQGVGEMQQVHYTLLPYTPLVHSSRTLLSYTPLIHSSHPLLSYTSLIHSSHTLLACTPLIHSSRALLSCTSLMHSSHALLSYTPLMHSSHTLLLYTPLMHSSHALLSCTPLMHFSHTLHSYTAGCRQAGGGGGRARPSVI